MSFRIAAASSDGINIDQHFGNADSFRIFDVESSGQYKLLSVNTVPVKRSNACSAGTGCGCHSIQQINTEHLEGAKYVLVSGIGRNMEKALQKNNITAFAVETTIDEAIKKIVIYENRLNRFK